MLYPNTLHHHTNETPLNIFDQFVPVSIHSLPLTLLSGLIIFSWLLLNNYTHWKTNRSNVILICSRLLPSLQWNRWLLSIFLLCLAYNLLSIIPYTLSHTSHLSVTFSLSFPIWVTFQITGFTHNWKAKISHLLPQGTPIYLIPFMIIIETISLCIQPLTLGFRLGANLLAGHLLIFLCSCVVWNVVSSFSLSSVVLFFLLLALLILELAVACIQAIVFLILSKQYLEENIN
uniref:ATP synthase subunit a n=1 Tax=Ophioceres incipiens TaxID=1815129 RepID=A0A3G2WI69_9ECHI|nr:ATP synthase F0 subunit 6 [Ophioceres incipiens]AYO99640.1 ATP synthase F0 subunit 6 [Ophioceres incipiens]